MPPAKTSGLKLRVTAVQFSTGKSTAILVIGLLYVPCDVFTDTTLTNASLPGYICMISPKGHFVGTKLSSRRTTTSPAAAGVEPFSEFVESCQVLRGPPLPEVTNNILAKIPSF